MIGLRTQENEKFENFFSLVQKEAQKYDSVFFADCGEGKIFEYDTFECEDCMGWLIPSDSVAEFERLFTTHKEDDFNDYEKCYVYMDYNITNNIINISFK